MYGRALKVVAGVAVLCAAGCTVTRDVPSHACSSYDETAEWPRPPEPEPEPEKVIYLPQYRAKYYRPHRQRYDYDRSCETPRRRHRRAKRHHRQNRWDHGQRNRRRHHRGW